MKYDIVGQQSASELNILQDAVISLTGQRTSVWYSETLRLIEAIVEVDGPSPKTNDLHHQQLHLVGNFYLRSL